jgi:hypothetical protein
MGNVKKYIPAFQYGHKLYPENMVNLGEPLSTGRVWYVDGDKTTGGAGAGWSDAFATIQAAIDAASAGDVIYIAEKTITALATDPVSYAETLIIPNSKPHLSLIGVSRGLAQGGLPQIKETGDTNTTHLLDVRAPGCLIANLGFNGAGSLTDGGASGIYLNDDGGTTYVAFGTTIMGCHFKNLGRGHAGTAAAIMFGSTGGAWQVRIANNRFYKCLAGVCNGGGQNVIQDVVIEGNWFGSAASTDVDCDIDLGNSSGVTGLVIDNNVFATVDVPSHSGGAVARYLDLTSCKGILSNNTFACKVNESATPVTFKAAGTAALIPTTVRMAGNTGEASTDGTMEPDHIYRAA